jgi:hypothetical protein
MTRVAIRRLDLVFGATARPDLVGGGGKEALVGMELLGARWHPTVAGGEVRAVVASPPPPRALSMFHLDDILGALVAFSAMRRAVPWCWC